MPSSPTRTPRALWRRDRPFRVEYRDAANVLGLIRGRTRPERVIVVSAHYDHLGRREGRLFPGADDNASGVATLLALVAWFQAHPPAHSLAFAAFDAEELGLRGARAFLDSGLLPAERIVVNVNLDMLARGDRGRVFVAGTAHTPELRAVVEQAARRSATAVHLGHDRPLWRTGLIDDWTTGSDHGAFHARGIPFLYFGVEDHPDYHAPTDTFERIPQRFFLQAAETVLDTLLALDARP
jgi:Zn-dependent M28 family amino/carboxypeptidase